MRERIARGGAPIGGFLKVKHLVGRAVDAFDVFAVGIVYDPGFSRQAFAVFVKHVEFGDCCVVLPVDGVDSLYGDVSAFGRCVEFAFLPSVACIERACQVGVNPAS